MPDPTNPSTSGAPDSAQPASEQHEPAEPSAVVAPGSGKKPKTPGMQLLVGVLIAGLAFVLTTQVLQDDDTEDFSSFRGAELGELLKSLDATNERLSRQISELTETRDSLRDSSLSAEQAEIAAQERADELAILAGTVPAQGPGVVLTISDPDNTITAAILLDAVEELRDAGAEVVAINQSVRVVANTFFVDTADGVEVAGELLAAPFVLEAIGDPPTMAEAARFRGGIVDRVQARGGSTLIEEREMILVTAVVEPLNPQHARPSS